MGLEGIMTMYRSYYCRLQYPI